MRINRYTYFCINFIKHFYCCFSYFCEKAGIRITIFITDIKNF